MLHLLDRRVGWWYAHPCAATRAGSNQVVLLIGAGVCASAVESAQVAVQLPAVSDTHRCTPVIVFAWMVRRVVGLETAHAVVHPGP